MNVKKLIAIVTFIIIFLNLLIPNVALATNEVKEKIENNTTVQENNNTMVDENTSNVEENIVEDNEKNESNYEEEKNTIKNETDENESEDKNEEENSKENLEENKNTDDEKPEKVNNIIENKLENIKELKSGLVSYKTHVAEDGWQDYVKDGELSGTTGQGKRVEAIQIELGNSEEIPEGASIKYEAHVQEYGWMDWKENGQIAGTTGESKRIEAIKIALVGMEGYSVMYRTHIQDIGWTDWVSNGEISGTTGQGKQVEAIEIKLVKMSKVEVNYVRNPEDNTVIVAIKSDTELQNTKPTWSLSEDRKTYTKIYTQNQAYSTPIVDINGNTIEVEINVTEVDDKGPEIEIGYSYDQYKNIVTVTLQSNEVLAHTKPTWSLSEDKKTYTKVFEENTDYTTPIEDIYGNKTEVNIKINQLDNEGPKVSVNYNYNEDNTITVTMTSNEILADTKPTWTLSEDKKTYTKIFSDENIEYTTPVEDVYGNQSSIKIKIKTKIYTYPNAGGPNITVKYLYDSNEIVTVYMISDIQFDNTKPTWTLSEDGKTYTKKYTNNDIYTTAVQDIKGNKVDVNIIVNFFDKDTYQGIDVSYFQNSINWIGVSYSGIDFAMIRAGYRGYGAAGTLVTDMQFAKNVMGAKANNIDIGLYFFTQAVTVQEAVEEANYVLNLVRVYGIDVKYPIAIDTEYSNSNANGRADGLDVATRTAVCKAFCDTIRNAGYTPAIYASKNWFYNMLDFNQLSGYDIWLAHYTTETDFKYTYDIWQYTSSGSVNGIAGTVDKNIAYKKY